jgi:DNA-3-methyladenine glycosylase
MTAPLETISRENLPPDTVALAKFLIGKIVVRRLPEIAAACRIVETEAYLADDRASHGFRGRTARNAVMFGERGYAYVYLAYGVSYMLNVSSGAEGVGEGVLIRAAEPLSGVAAMQARRDGAAPRDLLRGPGRLAKALEIDRSLNGVDLCEQGSLWLAVDAAAPPDIAQSVRIGITKDAHRPLRFFASGSPFVSGPASLNKPGR